MKKSGFLLLVVITTLFCGCWDIEVENLNEPSLSHLTGEPEMLESLAGGLFKELHNTMQEYDGPALSMSAMADQNTCSWGTAGMKDLSSEPRQGWNNSVYYAYYYAINPFWVDNYAIISKANDILNVLNNSKSEEIDESEKTKLEAWCNFIKGIAHGYIGLTFDRGNVLRGNPETDSLGFVPWQTMIDVSLEFLDEAIEIAETNSFTIPAKWMGGESYSNLELAQLANSFAARVLVYSSRNKTQNENLDWNRVLDYAKNGIQKPLQPVLGDAYDFYDMFTVYARYPGWVRIDHRIINLMDPDYPSYWPQLDWRSIAWETPDGKDPGPANSGDGRLKSDFQYLDDNNYPPDRGLYHFSHYRHSRFDSAFSELWYGSKAKPSMLVWENEMIIAEANVRLGNTSEVRAILNDNSGARKVRGELPDIENADSEKLLWHIFYERDIELINTGMGISYFDMRRRDMLQRGTILHFPVPAGELQIMNLDIYTIGLIQSRWRRSSNEGQNPLNGGKPDGENVSMGSWTGLDGITVPPGIVP